MSCFAKVNGDQSMKILLSLENIVFDLKEGNVDLTVEKVLKLFDQNNSYSFCYTICRISFLFYISHNYNIDLLLQFINELHKQISHKFNFRFNIIFASNLNKFFIKNGINFILDQMVIENMISYKICRRKNSPFFMQYNDNWRYQTLYADFTQTLSTKFNKEAKRNYYDLSENHFELHKKLIKDGHNPNEIAKIIRNDEIEKLQETSSQMNFDYNQKIKPSLYERCSFINHENVTLIDYAAFFSSVKCFKYLLMNNANVENTGKYAVVGGNEEIIYLCEQNHSTFDDSYETAIMFHRNDIFKYLYENKLKNLYENQNFIDDRCADTELLPFSLEELGKFCILYHNYEIFSFLLKEGMKINDDIIKESAKIGNLYIIQYVLGKIELPKNVLLLAIRSGNTELVKFLLKQKEVDVNFRKIYLKFMFKNYIWKLIIIFETPLLLESKKGNVEIVKLLLKKKDICINAIDIYFLYSEFSLII